MSERSRILNGGSRSNELCLVRLGRLRRRIRRHIKLSRGKAPGDGSKATKPRPRSRTCSRQSSGGFHKMAASVRPATGRRLLGSASGIRAWRRIDECSDVASAGKTQRRCFDASQSNLVSSGTTSNRSPTRPISATWKMGASSSLLMATMALESFIPARCWMAPEMPTAI